MGCRFQVSKEEPATSEQGPRTPSLPMHGSSVGSASLDAVLSEVKTMLAAEKALNAKCHEDLLSFLPANLTCPPPSPYSLPCSLHVSTLLFFLSPCLHQLFARFAQHWLYLILAISLYYYALFKLLFVCA